MKVLIKTFVEELFMGAIEESWFGQQLRNKNLKSRMKATQMSQNSLSQPGMMRIAMGTPKPGEQAGMGEEDPHHRHSLGKAP